MNYTASVQESQGQRFIESVNAAANAEIRPGKTTLMPSEDLTLVVFALGEARGVAAVAALAAEIVDAVL